MPIALLTAVFALSLVSAASDPSAPPASPAPAASTAPSPEGSGRPRPTPFPSPRPAVNTCVYAKYYTWARGADGPVAANTMYARSGEQVELRMGPFHSLDGHSYYQTTFPAPSGTGYLWVSAGCFNP